MSNRRQNTTARVKARKARANTRRYFHQDIADQVKAIRITRGGTRTSSADTDVYAIPATHYRSQSTR